MASPATRARAKLAGIDLTTVNGSGRDGRIQRQDLESAINDRTAGKAPAPASTPSGRQVRTGTEEIRILGVRRVSAQRVADSKRNIPHFAYVEEVDMTELERLRKHLNSQQPKGSPSYTYLPFLAMALVRVVEQFPKVNSRYDSERNVLVRHDGIHIGVATQTTDGLRVPVVKHAESLSLKELAAEIRRVTGAARDGTASRNELQGSTITITSLGKLGGIVSTPIINAPEVAIVGINKAVERPMIVNGEIAVRLDDEPVLLVRSPLHRRLRRRRGHPGAERKARAAGHDLHPGLMAWPRSGRVMHVHTARLAPIALHDTIS